MGALPCLCSPVFVQAAAPSKQKNDVDAIAATAQGYYDSDNAFNFYRQARTRNETCYLTLNYFRTVGLQSRFGCEPAKFLVICPDNGTAVLAVKATRPLRQISKPTLFFGDRESAIAPLCLCGKNFDDIFLENHRFFILLCLEEIAPPNVPPLRSET